MEHKISESRDPNAGNTEEVHTPSYLEKYKCDLHQNSSKYFSYRLVTDMLWKFQVMKPLGTWETVVDIKILRGFDVVSAAGSFRYRYYLSYRILNRKC